MDDRSESLDDSLGCGIDGRYRSQYDGVRYCWVANAWRKCTRECPWDFTKLQVEGIVE